MSKTPFTPIAEDSTQVKIWIQNDLLEWLDSEAIKDERSRAFLINQALHYRRNELERRRKKQPRRNERAKRGPAGE